MASRIVTALGGAARHGLRTVLALALVAGVLALGQAPASATTRPGLMITGEPTPDETTTIDTLWREFTDRFAPQWSCVGPIEVRVVDRAEDHYSGRNFGSIAAFYRVPPDAIVFVEHGKVNGDNLFHEFAHHLDLSCGIGDSTHGREFRATLGYTSDSPWLRGATWATVPAEGFAESVIATFGETPAITTNRDALGIVWRLARVPVWLSDAPPLPYGFPGTPDLAKVLRVPTGVVGIL